MATTTAAAEFPIIFFSSSSSSPSFGAGNFTSTVLNWAAFWHSTYSRPSNINYVLASEKHDSRTTFISNIFSFSLRPSLVRSSHYFFFRHIFECVHVATASLCSHAESSREWQGNESKRETACMCVLLRSVCLTFTYMQDIDECMLWCVFVSECIVRALFLLYKFVIK